ncbi:hypothetical protein F5Y12DRAFT_240164 [Xylaria sp. FL1777]|nr:hypothetical protein F5Y12DRAFT_240164 [Xylaria sp. FL1777]
MASSQSVAGRPSRHRRHTSASEYLDWEPRREESRHSMPHRTRQPEIQRPDRRKPKNSSRPSRPSEDLDARSMPPVRRLLTRPTTPKPRGRRLYDDDEEDEDDDDSGKERLRSRLRSRSRVTVATSRAKSRVKSRPTSRSSQSSDSIVPTPTPSSYVNIRSVPSAPSPRSLSGSSSDDSDDESSDSTQDYRMKARMKERMNVTPDSEPVANPPSRSRSRHKSRERIVPEIESPTDDSEGPPRSTIILTFRTLENPHSCGHGRLPPHVSHLIVWPLRQDNHLGSFSRHPPSHSLTTWTPKSVNA